MGTTYRTLDQGTTLAWTEAYGSASPRERAREWFRDALFTLALLGLAAGVAGFVAYENPDARYAESAAQHPAL